MIDILIPVFNNSMLTLQALKDYSMLDNEKHTITIFNNGSTDNTKQTVESFAKDKSNIKLINNEKNIGFAKACNKMFSKTNGDIVIFSNNDIRANSNDWTNIVIESLEKYDLVSPTAGLIDNNCRFVYETQDPEKRWNYLSGWMLCGYRKTFEKFLEFNENPFTEDMTTYFEDTWLSFRAKSIGLKLGIINVPVNHLGMMTSRKLDIQKLYINAKTIFIEKCKKEGISP